MRDIYVDQKSGVLLNKLGITDSELLRKAESDITIVRLKEILEENDFKYDYKYYLALHKKMFDDIYPFAGEIRKIDMEKHEKILSGFPMIFGDSNKILEKLKNAFKEKKVDFSLSNDEITKGIVNFMSTLWEIHPFREGNTRTIITYVIKYVKSNELSFDENLLLHNFAYIRDALVMSVYNEPKYLEKIIFDSIERGMKL